MHVERVKRVSKQMFFLLFFFRLFNKIGKKFNGLIHCIAFKETELKSLVSSMILKI